MQNYNARYSPYRVKYRKPYWAKTHPRVDRKRGWSPINRKDWRDSNDYREEYFKRNRGIAGLLYICSQCFKPMMNRNKIEVDHIIPPSRYARRKRSRNGYVKTSATSVLLNNTFNCAAICPPCNRHKSDKVGWVTFKGIAAKSIEVAVGLSAMAIVLALTLTLMVLPLPFKILRLMRRGSNSRYRVRYGY